MKPFFPLLLFLFLFSGFASIGAELIPHPLDQEIKRLLAVTETSGATFVRNGKEHTAAEAVEHMMKKYVHFQKKGRIASTEDFIALAGTKSMMSGNEYTLRMPDGRTHKSGEWLTARLAEIRSASASE